MTSASASTTQASAAMTWSVAVVCPKPTNHTVVNPGMQKRGQTIDPATGGSML